MAAETDAFDMDRRRTIIALVLLTALALALRVAYLWAALDNLGLEQFWNWAPDSNTYWTVSQHFLDEHPLGGYALFRVGPGYGLILAVLQLLFGPSPLSGILFSVVMGALAPALVYLLAVNLIGSRTVAFVAGLIAAISPTSVSLSCHILTDQPFFTLHVAALLCFVLGIRRGGLKWFVWAGVLAGVAAYIRPSGQFWPFVFIGIAILVPLQGRFESRRDMLKKATMTGLIMLVMVTAWSARNYAVHGIFTFGTNGMLTLRSCLVAQIMAEHYEGKIYDYRKAWEAEDGDRSEAYAAAYYKARERVIDAVKTHPGWLLRAYFRNLEDNIEAANGYVGRQIPSLRKPMDILNRHLARWGGVLLAALSLFGLILLFIRRDYLAGITLGATYVYFTLIVGLSYWQGSRLHYPAEMAWAILVPYSLLWTATKAAGWTADAPFAARLPEPVRRRLRRLAGGLPPADAPGAR